MKIYLLMILAMLALGYKVGASAHAQAVQIQAHQQAVFNQVFAGD
ncbi:MAG: hypothetical protein ACXWQO_15050 [Bdellovibrionota bacterium]